MVSKTGAVETGIEIVEVDLSKYLDCIGVDGEMRLLFCLEFVN